MEVARKCNLIGAEVQSHSGGQGELKSSRTSFKLTDSGIW